MPHTTSRRQFLKASLALAALGSTRAHGVADTVWKGEFRAELDPLWLGLPPGIQIDRDVIYKDSPGGPLHLDIYRPEVPPATPLPWVVWICGGGWREMNKRGALKHVAWLTGHGLAVVAMNYRLSPAAQFPIHLIDCWDAVAWVRARAADFELDPARIGVIGDSAGGHLALYFGTGRAAAVCDRTKEFAVGAVCALCPPTDLTDPDAVPADLWTGFIGGPPNRQPALARLASPLHQLTPAAAGCRHLLLHGEADSVVPIAQSERMVVALRTLASPVDFLRFPGVGHTNDFYRHHATRYRILDFFKAAL